MLLLVLAAVWLFFYFATNGTFLTQRNLVLLALQTSIVSLAAISAVMLIVTRNFDLSVGSAVALVGVILALLTVKHDVNPVLAVPLAIAGGVLMGAWQGFWVTRIGVSSFIVTLAGMLYFRGISMIATNGATVAPLPRSLDRLRHRLPAAGSRRSPPSSLALAAYGALAACRDPAGAGARGRRQVAGRSCCARSLPAIVAASSPSGSSSWQGIPYLVLLVALCTLAAEFVMRRTRYGAQLYAIGGNPEAARLSGINVDARDLLEFRHCRPRLRDHRRRADRARQRRHRRQRRACSSSSTPSPRRSSAARRSQAAAAASSARCSARC